MLIILTKQKDQYIKCEGTKIKIYLSLYLYLKKISLLTNASGRVYIYKQIYVLTYQMFVPSLATCGTHQSTTSRRRVETRDGSDTTTGDTQ